MNKLFQYAGIAASVVLIAFGIGAVVIGINGRDRVATELGREQIVGTPDSTIPNQLVNSGGEAQAFAKVMRKHTLEATGGKTYAQMPQYITADGKGTSDKAAAGKDPKTGAPTSNPARQIWVTETALTTALNTAYFAESMATFVAAMGGALLLIGIGLLVLSLRVLRQPSAESVRAQRPGGEGRRRRRLERDAHAPRGLAAGREVVHAETRGAAMTPETNSRTIVVGYDGSRGGARRRGARHRSSGPGRPPRHRARLPDADRPHRRVVLHRDGGGRLPVRHQDLLDGLERDCERLATIEHERDLAVGSAATAIVRAAETHDAAEIVIGSRGVGRMRALLGSVAHDVIHRAHCPVTVIPERMAERHAARLPRRRAPSERAQS